MLGEFVVAVAAFLFLYLSAKSVKKREWDTAVWWAGCFLFELVVFLTPLDVLRGVK